MTQTDNRQPLALVIDDDPLVRLLIREALAKNGMDVQEAADGETGLTLGTELLPDIILLDVIMPGIDGYTVCDRIRNDPSRLRQTPVIMLTGLEDVESIDRAYQMGATDFIAKPVNLAILPHRVRYILRSSQAFAQLAISEATLASAQHMAKLVSWELDVVTGELRCAAEIDHLLNRKPQKPLQSLSELFTFVGEEDRKQAWDAFQMACDKGTPINIVFRVSRCDGKEAIFHAQSEGEAQSGVVRGTLQDITNQRRLEDRASFLSLHDELTGLPNRSLFKELTAHELAQARRHGFKVAGLFLDLNKFQRINDTFGHDVGDELLVSVAARLNETIRGSDYLCRSAREAATTSKVARLGGDEFSILLTGIRTSNDAARIARRVIDHFRQPFELEGREFFVGISIGITLFPDDCFDPESFIKHGDSAMHFAKERGTDNIEFFNQTANAATSRKLQIETQLRRAVVNRELVLHYQPKVEAETGRIIGAEALVRWQHPERGLVPPTQFIPVAEESGLIIPIGEWVIREACRQSKQWDSQGVEPLTIAINLSAVQFHLPDICEKISGTAHETGINPARIEVELTESMLVDDVDGAIRTMHQLRDCGIRLSIDDFGTGYSSLSYLMRFPLHALKIDRSFTSGIETDPGNAAIVTAIIAMAKSLNLQVIAEGVENESQVNWLKEKGCDVFQGYYFSTPLTPDALVDFYRRTPHCGSDGQPS